MTEGLNNNKTARLLLIRVTRAEAGIKPGRVMGNTRSLARRGGLEPGGCYRGNHIFDSKYFPFEFIFSRHYLLSFENSSRNGNSSVCLSMRTSLTDTLLMAEAFLSRKLRLEE